MVLQWFLKSKKNIAACVTFTPAKHLLVDTHLDTLAPSLEKSTITFTNSMWLIFRGTWCPPPLCHPQGRLREQSQTCQVHPRNSRQRLLGSSSQTRGRKKERENTTPLRITLRQRALEIQTGFLKKCTFKTFNAAHHAYTNRTGLHIQSARSRSDTQLSVQRHFPSNVVHSDLLGSFMD